MVLGPGAQYFSIHLPSATTVSFTVSTRPLYAPVSSTKTLRSLLSRLPLLSLIKHILRVILISFALLVNLAKVEDVAQSPLVKAYAEFWLSVSLLGGFVKLLAEMTEWWMLVPISLGIVYACLRRDYVEESLLVLQGLGIQTSTSSRYFFTGATTTFIPTTQIQDIVIHEAFKGLEVRFYLAVIVEGATEMVVVFPTLLPRRDILEEVWRGSRKCLYSGIR